MPILHLHDERIHESTSAGVFTNDRWNVDQIDRRGKPSKRFQAEIDRKNDGRLAFGHSLRFAPDFPDSKPH